jgi:hypothetical protein
MTEWQHLGNQINAAMIFARACFGLSRGEQSGLLTHIAATRTVLIVRPGPPGAPGRPNCDGNNDDGGE